MFSPLPAMARNSPMAVAGQCMMQLLWARNLVLVFVMRSLMLLAAARAMAV